MMSDMKIGQLNNTQICGCMYLHMKIDTLCVLTEQLHAHGY